MKERWSYIVVPVLGAVLCLWYAKCATYDVVYTDYIRLVNTHLSDMMSPNKFFVPDVLTRIPINYLGRMINVLFLHYNTIFDVVLRVLGLGLAGGALAYYYRSYSLDQFRLLLLSIPMLGPNKWEMLTNGTGQVHFLAIACFLYHYLILDRIWHGMEKRYDRAEPTVPPPVIILGVAGPYYAIYTIVPVLSCGYYMVGKAKHSHIKKPDYRYFLYIVCALIPLFLYLWNNSHAVEDHADMQNLPLIPTLLDVPKHFPHFFLKSLASDVLDVEMLKTWVEHGVISDGTAHMLGIPVLFVALLALWMSFQHHLYKKTTFPLTLLMGGGSNHLLILHPRWGFVNENYGISSRYALQFQFMTSGIILTMALIWEQIRRQVAGVLAGLCCVAVMSGSTIAMAKEIEIAPYWEEYGQEIAIVAPRCKEISDEVLQETLDYRKTQEGGGAKVRAALEILDENGLDIYRGNTR